MEIVARYFLPGALAVTLALLSACRRVDVRETVIETPGVRSGICAELVLAALAELNPPPQRSAQKAIDMDRTWVDTTNGLVHVRYDSMQLALKNLEFAITKAGFDANRLEADAAARRDLPPECRDHAD